MATTATAIVTNVRNESTFAMYAHAFGGLFLRDLYVLRRELFPFAIRVG